MEHLVQSKNVLNSIDSNLGSAKNLKAPDFSQSLDYDCGHDLKTANHSKNSKPACGCRHDCGQIGSHESDHDHSEGMKAHEKISLVVAGAFVALSLIGEHLLGNELFAMLAAGIAILAGLIIILPETIESIKARSIDINVLIIVAIIGAVYVRAYEEAAAVLFLFSVGEYLEGRALRKSNDAIKDLAKLAPDTALVIRRGETLELATDQVLKGETMVVKPGMSVALDGIITRGSSFFNDAAITGESLPVYKSVGDTVFAASLAVDGACEIETTSTVADSTLAKIARMVEEAQKQKSSREYFVQRFAKVYTPIVVIVALLIALLPSLITLSSLVNIGAPDTWIYRACELLVISCPCAFVISTPVTMVSALARAAKMGVLVKGGAFFEEGARVHVAAFDKTGTLTEGCSVVAAVRVMPQASQPTQTTKPDQDKLKLQAVQVIKTAPGSSEMHAALGEEVIALAAALESHSTHPLALAILNYAQSHGIAFTKKAENIKETAGKGIVGIIAGQKYAIGSPAFMSEDLSFGKELNPLLDTVAEHSGTTLVVTALGANPRLLGIIVASDVIREASKSALVALHELKGGVKAIMLTGDNEKVASSVAASLGIDEVHASLSPQDKTAEIQRIQQSLGSVAYTGDGINDAPSLAVADVGIAMGGAGSSAALSSADVVLMADDLSALPKFFKLSTKTVRILKQNVVLAIGLKVLVALLVIFGVAQMWLAVLADTGVSLLVILNGMRLLRIRL